MSLAILTRAFRSAVATTRIRRCNVISKSRLSIHRTTSWYKLMRSFDLTTVAKKWLSLCFEVDVDIAERMFGRGMTDDWGNWFLNSTIRSANLTADSDQALL